MGKKFPRRYRPTPEQVAEVARMFDEGYDPSFVRQRIVDPETGDAVDGKAFKLAFAAQLAARQAGIATMEAFTPSPAQRRQVRAAVLHGYPEEMVARMVINTLTGRSITTRMLRRHFRDELDLAEMLCTVSVTNSLLRAVRGGSVSAMTYYLDNVARKKGAADGAKAKTGIIVVPGDLPRDEWQRIATLNQEKLAEEARRGGA